MWCDVVGADAPLDMIVCVFGVLVTDVKCTIAPALSAGAARSRKRSKHALNRSLDLFGVSDWCIAPNRLRKSAAPASIVSVPSLSRQTNRPNKNYAHCETVA